MDPPLNCYDSGPISGPISGPSNMYQCNNLDSALDAYLLNSDLRGNNGVVGLNELPEDLGRDLEEPLMSGDWVSPGKPEDQALPTTSPQIPPNASPAVAPNTPNAPSVDEAASSYTQVGVMGAAGAADSEEPRGRGRGRKRSRGGGADSASRGPPRKRGPKPVRYCSQIAPETNGIKLRIKKFINSSPVEGATETSTSSAAPPKASKAPKPPKPPREPRRKKQKRRSKHKRGADTESEEEEALLELLAAEEDRAQAWGRRAPGPQPSQSFSVEDTTEEGEAQSGWGCRLPEEVLARIFAFVVAAEGSLPFLVRASRVCRLWRNAAMSSDLWRVADLSAPWVRQVHRNDLTLRWLCENRLSGTRDLVLNWWKVSNVSAALSHIVDSCGEELRGIGLAGWGGLRGEHLETLAASCPHLARIDLSSVNSEVVANSKTAVSPVPLCNFTKDMSGRLTHLTLANNTVAGLTQILNSVAENCPDLQVLDLSNLRTAAITSALIPLERLQEGCSKLRVFRIANSNVALAPTSLKEQAASPGFPLLEELSLAVDKQGGQPQVSDSAIERICKTSHQLRLLDVRGCIRISDSSLVRVPAWDLEHLFLSGCYVTRPPGDGLELLVRKWCHSLVELDLAWSTATEALDLAVAALAEKGDEAPIRVLSLLGSSVTFGPVKSLLQRCPQLHSLNLASCRGLPRGIKRLYVGSELAALRTSVARGKYDEGTSEEGETSPSGGGAATSPQDDR